MIFTIASIALSTSRSDAPELGLIPKPRNVQLSQGEFVVNDSTVILAGRGEKATAELLAKSLRPSTGLSLNVVNHSQAKGIYLKIDPKLQGVGKEGYQLNVLKDEVRILAPTEAGLFYGTQTLRQLFPPESFGSRVVNRRWALPAVTISDEPRFKWRGAHLDVARNFMPKEEVLKFIDRLAMHKLNTFHWHLTDDQGWRIEIKKYPKLTEIGSKRTDTMLVYGNPGKYEGKPHEGFYTQRDIREVVAYAKARHVTVVPEIEMPGHAQAAIAAYPELGNTGKPLPVATIWGVIENVFNVEDSTIKFLQDVLVEVMALFPSEFIHIGGDECPKSQWKASPAAQAKMKKLGLKDEHELQSWFVSQMDTFLDSKGRRLIGWSEIVEGGLAPGAALMVWLGDDGAMTAVKSGHDVVMAQTSHLYFDYYQVKDRTGEPHAIGGHVNLAKVYSYEPILPQMTAEQGKHVMGVQFQTWTEYIRTADHAAYMVYPRACALAEVAWSAKEQREFNDFMYRLPRHLLRLKAAGVNYRPIERGIE